MTQGELNMQLQAQLKNKYILKLQDMFVQELTLCNVPDLETPQIEVDIVPGFS